MLPLKSCSVLTALLRDYFTLCGENRKEPFYLSAKGERMKQIVLKIGGMSCSACSNGLEKFLKSRDGVIDASVNLVLASATVDYDEKVLNKEKIEKFVKKAGFSSLGLFSLTEQEQKSKWAKPLFWIFSVLALILLYVSMGAMVGLPEIPFVRMHQNPKAFSVCLLGLSLPFLAYGFDILKAGFNNLIHRSPNMDTLVSIGVISSFIYSVFGTVSIFKGDTSFVHHLYFESVGIVIYFLKLGRFIDSKTKSKTKEAIKSLVQITPRDAVILVDGKEKRVTIDCIKKGDTVVSKPGEKIAVDGTVLTGNAHIDESFITGESKPKPKTAGDTVLAGSHNFNGYLEYKAEKIGRESTVSEIVNIVVKASSEKPKIAMLADKISGIFVPVVCALAVLGFAVNLIFSDLFMAVNSFVTTLVVACPCSLGLAAPLCLVVAEGECAKRGILIKKTQVLETAEKVNTVVFDKTGTLTYGRLKIAEILNKSSMTDKELLRIIGSLEQKSTHPIAGAFDDYFQKNGISAIDTADFENLDGLGIIGEVDGKKVMLGNQKLLEKYNIKNPFLSDIDKISADGNSVVIAVIDGEVSGIIGVRDVLREEITDVISLLKQKNITPVMLTGDNELTAKRVAKQVGIDEVYASVLPKFKGEKIAEIKKDRFVVMVGDGINDSPALAISDIGISPCSGTDIAVNSADVVIMNDNMNNIHVLLEIGKKTVNGIKLNLFWAFFYNCLMIPVALGVLSPFGITINPMIAGVAMTLSSITVILNSLRLKGVLKK